MMMLEYLKQISICLMSRSIILARSSVSFQIQQHSAKHLILSFLTVLLCLSHLSQAADSCIAYQEGNTNICKQCDTGFVLLLYDNTHTICATLDGGGTTCTIDSGQYATQYSDQQTNSIVYTYYSGDDIKTPYCFNCKTYFTRKLADTDASPTELCSTCSQQDLSSNFFLQSIYGLTQGCANCQVNARSQQSVTYLPQLQLYMRECSAFSGQTAACKLSQYYDAKSKTCLECNTLFPNCAACTASACTLCPKHFYWHPSVYDYATGASTKGQCVFNICPAGTCKNEKLNSCETSTLSNCQICQVDSTDSTKQLCEVCKPGYLQHPTTGVCTALGANGELTYFVKGGAPIKSDSYVYDPTVSGVGTAIGTPFLLIQEALSAINSYQAANMKSLIKATVYLCKGDHFFFQCDGDEDQGSQTEFASFVKYCESSSFGASTLMKAYTLFDKISITFKPLYCSYGKSLSLDTDPAFIASCLPDSTKPIVYVNHATASFNITGSMAFENIKFTGINGLVVPTKDTHELSVFPVQFCEVTTEPNGYEAIFKLQKKSNTNSDLFSYSCKDSWYTAPQRPDMSIPNRRCLLNSNAKFNPNQESGSLTAKEDPAVDDNFFWLNPNNVYSKRRLTLFNLYTFPDYQSNQKTPSSLLISGCDFEYFLGGYQSLISFENNNLQKVTKSFTWTTVNQGTSTVTKPFFTFNSGEKGIQVRISSSTFKNSRFSKGLITYRKPIYISQRLSFTNYTHLFSPLATNNDIGSMYIAITSSSFTQLNIFTNVTALSAYSGQAGNNTLKLTNQLEAITYRAFMHKGIVLNVEDFPGIVEVTESSFSRNMHFIPEAVALPRGKVEQLGIEQFRDPDNKEYKITVCDPDTLQDINFFTRGVSMDNDLDAYFDKFERLSLIYISRNLQMMYFKNNRFLRNSGTFGGAIAINSPNFRNSKQGRPYLVVSGCKFDNNQAFFSGNAIYLRNTKKVVNQADVCAGGYIIDSTFSQNVGTKIHNGGAISVLCEYIKNPYHDDFQTTSSQTSMFVAVDLLKDLTEPLDSVFEGIGTVTVYTFKFNIENSKFTENYSGLKGTAAYFKHVSKIRIIGSTFQNNGPTFTNFEYQYSPQTLYLTNRPITFFDPNQICLDEFQYLNDCTPVSGLIVDFPRVKGAIYVHHCQEYFCTNEADYQIVQILNSEFINNDAGPNLDLTFPSEDNAASIYIKGGLSTQIVKTKFKDHNGHQDYFTTNVAPRYGKYFPQRYYQYAQAPIIRISVKPEVVFDSFLYYYSNFTNCTFSNNYHSQILGYIDGNKQYFGSLISLDSNYLKNSMFLPVLTVAGTIIKDNKFMGNETSLIYAKGVMLNFTNNTAYGNGYLSPNLTKKSSSSDLDFEPYTFYLSQQYGVLYLKMLDSLPKSFYHIIRRNQFMFNFAQQGSSINLRLEGNFVLLEGNVYKNNYAIRGASVFVQTQDNSRSTLKVVNETIENQFGVSQGAISLQPVNQDVISIYIANSTFKNCWAGDGGSIYATNLAAAIVQNCSFTFSSLVNATNKTQVVAQQFIPTIWNLNEMVDLKQLYQITDNTTRNTGAIYLESGANSQSVNFTTSEYIRKATSVYTNYSEILDCKFDGLSAISSSAIYAGKGQYLRISNSNQQSGIKNLKQQSFGAIRIEGKSILVGENLTFTNNRAEDTGGVIAVGTQGQVYISKSVFQSNQAANQGGCIFISGNSKFNCSQCTFKNNYAKISSTVHAIGNEGQLLPINITNTSFISNVHEESLMTLISSNASFENVQFLDNIAQTINHGITISSSSVLGKNITVNYSDLQFLQESSQSLLNVDSGFFSLNHQSSLTLTKQSSISNCRGALTSAIQVLGKSSLNIDGSTKISNCLTLSEGSTIFLQSAKDSAINNAILNSNGDIDVLVDRSTVKIVNTTFMKTNSHSIKALRSSMFIDNGTFSESTNQYISGKAIYCQCNSLAIQNSSFSSLSSLEGGALYLTSSSSDSVFIIKNSNFTENQAMHGGAIKFQDASKLVLQSNHFLRNSAVMIDPSISYRLRQKALGGALNLDCNNNALGFNKNCDVQIIQGNKFINNSAAGEGGAIFYMSNIYSDDSTNIYSGNNASYAADIASYPKELKIEFIDNGDYFQPAKKALLRMLQSNDNNSQFTVFPQIVSGTPFSFRVSIIDQNGKLYTTDSESEAELTSVAGLYPVKIIGGRVKADKGMFNFTDVIVKVEPGAQVILSLAIKGLNTYQNSVDYFKKPLSISVQTRKCALGEELTDQMTCVQCSAESSYLLIAPQKATQCRACPSEAQCYGRNNVAPAPGYWRPSNDSEEFVACPNPDACLGGNQSQPTGVCAEGYTGVACGNCRTGYRRSAPFQCSRCPEFGINAVFFLVLLAIALLIVVLIVRTTLQGTTASAYAVLLKIILSHFQILGIIMSVEYNWPAELSKVQDGFAYFSGISQQIFSFDCFLQTGQEEEDQTAKIQMNKLVFFAICPILILLSSSVFWAIMGAIRRNFYEFKVKTIATTLVIFIIVHPSIARVYFQTFNCITILDEQRVRDDVSSLCFQGGHMLQVILLALPSIIIWVFTVPLAVLILLVRQKKKIAQIRQVEQLSKSDQHQIRELMMKYGFLFAGYKVRLFFWEIVIIFRKIFLVMLFAFLTVVSSSTQVLAGLLCLIVSMVLHVKFEPYSSIRMNRMEHYSLQVTSLTMYMGMFYVAGGAHMQGDAVKWFFFLAIVGPNSLFLLHWLNQMRIEILKLALANSKRLFRLVSCGLLDPDVFALKHQTNPNDDVYEEHVASRKDQYLQQSQQVTQKEGLQIEGSENNPEIKREDFDDIRVKRRQSRGINNFEKSQPDTPSSDSDFKKSLDFERNINNDNGGPDFDTDKSNGSKRQYRRVPPRLNLDQIKLDFPASMIRRIPSQNEGGNSVDEDQHTTIRRNTQNRLLGETLPNEDTNAVQPPRTYRDQSYRKIFPEQILTQRGIAPMNDYATRGTYNTDRSRAQMQPQSQQIQQQRRGSRERGDAFMDSSNSSRISGNHRRQHSLMQLRRVSQNDFESGQKQEMTDHNDIDILEDRSSQGSHSSGIDPIEASDNGNTDQDYGRPASSRRNNGQGTHFEFTMNRNRRGSDRGRSPEFPRQEQSKEQDEEEGDIVEEQPRPSIPSRRAQRKKKFI